MPSLDAVSVSTPSPDQFDIQSPPYGCLTASFNSPRHSFDRESGSGLGIVQRRGSNCASQDRDPARTCARTLHRGAQIRIGLPNGPGDRLDKHPPVAAHLSARRVGGEDRELQRPHVFAPKIQRLESNPQKCRYFRHSPLSRRVPMVLERAAGRCVSEEHQFLLSADVECQEKDSATAAHHWPAFEGRNGAACAGFVGQIGEGYLLDRLHLGRRASRAQQGFLALVDLSRLEA